MQKSTMVISVPLAEMDEVIRDVAAWPTFIPELEAVRETGNGRCTFTIRQDGRRYEVDVAVRRSPHDHGMLWTVVAGPAWNGHLYLQVAGAGRTRVHLELNVEARPVPDHLVELGLSRLQAAVARQRRVIRIPA